MSTTPDRQGPRPAKPRMGDEGDWVVQFYPLHAADRHAGTTGGAAAISLMMRNRKILVEWRYTIPSPPMVVHCSGCRLGMATRMHYTSTVTCIHGPWTRNADPLVAAARRMGAPVYCCAACGNVVAGAARTWALRNRRFDDQTGEEIPDLRCDFLDSLMFCGLKCQDRIESMFP